MAATDEQAMDDLKLAFEHLALGVMHTPRNAGYIDVELLFKATEVSLNNLYSIAESFSKVFDSTLRAEDCLFIHLNTMQDMPEIIENGTIKHIRDMRVFLGQFLMIATKYFQADPGAETFLHVFNLVHMLHAVVIYEYKYLKLELRARQRALLEALLDLLSETEGTRDDVEVPLSAEARKSLKPVEIGPLSTDPCTICQEPMCAGAETKYLALPCEHVFHEDCINQWFEMAHICPNCRHDLHN